MSEYDNRNVIKVEELSQNLDDEKIEKKIESYKGRIPVVLLEDLKEILKGKKITEQQLDKIIKRIENSMDSGANRIEDLYRKLENLEKLLKVQHKVEVGKSEDEEKKAEVSSDYPKKEEHTHEISCGEETNEVTLHESVNGKARLKEVPENPKGTMLLLKWIEHLIERVGYEGLEDVLNYYLDINWISEDVLLSILRYAKGIKLYHENSDWRPVGFMNVQDHLMSLMFIEALKTGRFNKELIMEVEREVYRMRKEVADLHGV
ncbi:hypothetical protein DRO97_03775 [Archaeoglobales archaeon]|nr:MAG: hypothetical protein DRO97_03775 [Archaeoglobales archaeon]